MSYVLTSSEELENLIQQTVGEKIKSLLPPTESEGKQRELLTRKETADLLQVSPVTLWQWDKDGKLKAVRLNSRVRYRMQDIEQFMNGQNQY